MCNKENTSRESHSYQILCPLAKSPQSDVYSKSDFNFTLPASSTSSSNSSNEVFQKAQFLNKSSNGEYYKKYEHDEVPVKDSDTSAMKHGIPRNKGSLTNSDLDNLERRIYQKVSQELQTDDSSQSSLDSYINFFKKTVEKIFDNFYTSMSDFEHYKKRFHEILAKNKEGSIDDMEEFIKDIFENIMSSNNSASNISHHSVEVAVTNLDEKESCVCSSGDTSITPDTGVAFVEEYKNDNYLTDSTLDENVPKTKIISSKIDEIFNIILLGGTPCVEIKLDGRNLLSEINIKEPTERATATTTSVDNMKRRAAKKLEVEKYIRQQHDSNAPDRDIPVKMSYAKKNIYLNEDFENNDTSNSFLAKICSILCRKFRKTTFGRSSQIAQ